MKNTLLKNTLLIGMISTPLLIVGCGGGTSTTTSTTTLSKISGTVPGTLIEAFCADGSYAQVTSTLNGTTQHPFEISVPQNVECRLVMTTNENDPLNRVITNIGFATATATGLNISLNQDVNLGFIPLALDPATVATVNQIVIDPLIVNLNGTTPVVPIVDTNITTPENPIATITNALITPYDTNGNGIMDAYEDLNANGIIDAYDDDDNDGTYNLHDDDDNDGRPDHVDDDDDHDGDDDNDDNNHDGDDDNDDSNHDGDDDNDDNNHDGDDDNDDNNHDGDNDN